MGLIRSYLATSTVFEFPGVFIAAGSFGSAALDNVRDIAIASRKFPGECGTFAKAGRRQRLEQNVNQLSSRLSAEAFSFTMTSDIAGTVASMTESEPGV